MTKPLTSSEMVARRNKLYGKEWLKENGKRAADIRKKTLRRDPKTGRILPNLDKNK